MSKFDNDTSEPVVQESEPVVQESESVQEDNPSAKMYGEKNVPLTTIDINNEGIALNVIIQFLVVAQKRGCFSLDESAKIFECIKMFTKPNP
jgi:hypothetical protein